MAERRGAIDDDDEAPDAGELAEMAHAAFIAYTETAQGKRGVALFEKIVPYLNAEDRATIEALPWDTRIEVVRTFAMIAAPATNAEGLHLLHQNFEFLERPLYKMAKAEEEKKNAPPASSGGRGHTVGQKIAHKLMGGYSRDRSVELLKGAGLHKLAKQVRNRMRS